MNLKEVLKKFTTAGDVASKEKTQVVCLAEDGATYTVQDVVLEYHTDMRCHTLWLKIEEN